MRWLAAVFLLAASPSLACPWGGFGCTVGSPGANVARVFAAAPASSDPYDLSGIETEMVLAFDDEGSARPSWPTEPSGLTTCTVTNATQLGTCLGTDNAHIDPDPGTYAGPFTISASNVHLEANSGDVTITGGLTINGTESIIHIEGVRFEGGQVRVSGGADDILWENVNLHLQDANGDNFIMCDELGANGCQRHAIINSTCEASRYCGYVAYDQDSTDLIFANYDAHSNYIAGASNDELAVRIMTAYRVLIVDSHFRTDPTNKPPLRFHYGAGNILVVDSILDKGDGGFATLWIDTDAGLGEQDDLDDIFIIRTQFNQDTATKISDIDIDDSNPGNGIDVIYVYAHDNDAHHASSTAFSIPAVPAATTLDDGGNTGAADFTAFPAFTGGADH